MPSFPNDGGSDPIISGQSVVPKWIQVVAPMDSKRPWIDARKSMDRFESLDLCAGHLRGLRASRVCTPGDPARVWQKVYPPEAGWGQKNSPSPATGNVSAPIFLPRGLGLDVTRVITPGMFLPHIFCRTFALGPAASRQQQLRRHPDTANPCGPLPVAADPSRPSCRQKHGRQKNSELLPLALGLGQVAASDILVVVCSPSPTKAD